MAESRSPNGDASRNGLGIAPPDFRAPSATRVGRVTLQVADLERSLGFYRDLLGFDLLEASGPQASLGAAARDGEPPDAGGATSGPDHVPLIELIERPGVTPVPPGGRLGLFHVAVRLPDRVHLGRVLGHLARQRVRLGASDHRVSEALYLSDPDGLGLEIYADRPRSAWPHDGRQIAIATAPLDADDVIAAGGGAPWDGMPAGTTIGHMHLSVDDLSQAEALFHRGLGLDKMIWSYPGALFLSAGGYHHHLGLNTWARGASKAGENDARLIEWRLVFPDAGAVSRALASVADAGFADLVDRSGSRIEDPWGVRVTLDTRA